MMLEYSSQMSGETGPVYQFAPTLSSPWEALPPGYYLGGLTVAVAVALVVCFFAGRLFQSPIAAKYKWGFFTSTACMVVAALTIIYLLNMRSDYSVVGGWKPTFMWALALLVCSLGAFFQTRWGIVGMTIISLNPLLWLYNIPYIRQRWKQLRPISFAWLHPRHLTRTKGQRYALLLCALATVLLAVQLIVAEASGSNGQDVTRCLNLRRTACGLGLSQTLLYLTLVTIVAAAFVAIFWGALARFSEGLRIWAEGAEHSP